MVPPQEAKCRETGEQREIFARDTRRFLKVRL